MIGPRQEPLIKAQIDNSLKLGWQPEDIIVIESNAYRSEVIYQLLTQRKVKEGELWWFHDLDVFQLHPMDSSQIDLQDYVAGFVDNGTGEFDLGSIFFRTDSERIFGWIRNRARKFKGDETAALMSLVAENYRDINSRYIKLSP